MFYPEKITNINGSDKVLEIGPGSTPYFRSDVFLEMIWDDEGDAIAQRGKVEEKIDTEKPIFYYDGKKFPFKDKEFDYIICSHVIEHVENVEEFISECIRVGKKGYFEYPTIYFEYIYNISVHLNVQKYHEKDQCFYYLPKTNLPIEQFKHIQKFIDEGMKNGYLPDLYNYITTFSIEGFEWEQKIKVIKAKGIEDLIDKDLKIPHKKVISYPEKNNISFLFYFFKIKKKIVKEIKKLLK
jgi:ubiquinone/menaquinone biosynthesis C-methylase UbiE